MGKEEIIEEDLEINRNELQEFYISFEIVVKDSGAGISQ